ncbi:MAG: hypothetical protein HKN78_13205 [Sphingomonadaceae bacterium]|nr:hypothetical protein [Sphingomonadaceae bacterium]
MRRNLLMCAGALALANCSGGEPGTAQDAEDYVRENFEDNGDEVSWVHAEDGEEPGNFTVYADVSTPGEEGSDETKRCNVSVASMSRSQTCQSLSPSIITQAANLLVEDYQSRGIEMTEHAFERNGEGFAFGGQAILRLQASGERASVECTGTQEGTRFNIDCNQDTARPLPPSG